MSESKFIVSKQSRENQMAKESGFWTVWRFPWMGRNPYKFGLTVMLLAYLIIASTWIVVYNKSGQLPSIVFWWIIFPLLFGAIFTTISFILQLLIKNLAKKLPSGEILRSDCMVVKNFLERPGLVQINDNTLIIQPLFGKEISIPLSEISNITERRWYNGRPYLGTTRFFKLETTRTVTGCWRLGFGVPYVDKWRELLNKWL